MDMATAWERKDAPIEENTAMSRTKARVTSSHMSIYFLEIKKVTCKKGQTYPEFLCTQQSQRLFVLAAVHCANPDKLIYHT
ncbi:hypothetical protein [Paenibacillus jiagnxiensis]|uniref:hypothetical protein n=1 Tax=Paenibacillus jiagnxiensis TaxID=3228926 RepID=UPI0038D48F1E